jgi:hypothetical protein
MNLKEFNVKNSGKKAEPRTPSLAIDFRTGVMQFNVAAAAKLGLTNGLQVKIFKDLDDVENWYVEVVDDGGFHLYDHTTAPACRFNAAAVAREIREDIGFNGAYGRVLVAGEPTVKGKKVLYGLIISRLKTVL